MKKDTLEGISTIQAKKSMVEESLAYKDLAIKLPFLLSPQLQIK